MSTRSRTALLGLSFLLCAGGIAWTLHRQQQQNAVNPIVLFDAVHSQVRAFQTSNFTSAYGLVSTRFQQHFTLQEFIERVRHDYGRILDAERVEFGPWFQRGSRATVQVFFIYADGNVAPCIYTLTHEGEHWKIEGARWVKGWKNGQRMRGIQS